jgi:hypothetical protein
MFDLFFEFYSNSIEMVIEKQLISLQKLSFKIKIDFSKNEEIIKKYIILEEKYLKNYQNQKKIISELKINTDIQEIDIYPNTSNLSGRDKHLVKNHIDGKYDNLNQYLSVHFRLHLEEFIYPIRNGIFQIKKGNKSDIKTYDNAKIIKTDAINFTTSFVLKFETKKKNLKSRSSLQISSMILLFKKIENEIIYDEDPYLMLVINRDKIDNNEILVQPIREKDLEIINGDNFFIFESPVFFPAINPVLKSLQIIKSVPFEDYLLLKNKDMKPPKYIDKNPLVEIESLQKNKTNKSLIVDVKKKWIDNNDSILDPSQNECMQYILNSKVALIQGPPGTG